MPEQKYDIPTGGKRAARYPDLVMQKGNKTIAIQVGKVLKCGKAILRERNAMDDLRLTGMFNHVFFLRY
ncbi:hypothetical protein HVZ66_12975 [Escherichia fergusonii]|nr:hypothetical protein [Escherichia fergusonii]QMC78477.1 hypothetical protein HVZ66_12975 [Escherichia fergusonii]HCO7576511.1 hypothetical protein [Escherichia fergusonii]